MTENEARAYRRTSDDLARRIAEAQAGRRDPIVAAPLQRRLGTLRRMRLLAQLSSNGDSFLD